MIFCENCGRQLSEEVKFCDGCGSAISGKATPTCANCNKPLEANQKFCDGCGMAVGGGSAPAQKPAQPAPAPVAVNTTTIMAKNFCCSNCGNSLEIPKNARGQVKCPYCKTECILDGIVKNAEIAAKNDVNSGVPLTATASILHSQLVSILSKSTDIPLDVYDNVEVIREERYCVPAYCFEYNGEAPFSYEEGKQETRQEKGFTYEGGDKITTIKEVKWHTERGTASVSGTLFVSGNKNLAPYINEIYLKTDHNQLVDFEYLEFPPDVKTLEYDLPQLTAFNEQIKPIVNKQLTKEGKKALAGTSYEGNIPRGGQYGVTYTRDFKLSGPKIQKEVTRVFLGLYCVVYKYGDKEYYMWATGDGQKVVCDELPIDPQRMEIRAEKQATIDAIPTKKKAGCWSIGFLIVFIIIGLIFLSESELVVVGVFIIAISIGIGLWIFSVNKKRKEYDAQRAEVQKDIDDFEGQLSYEIQRFKRQQKALRGIYEIASGDANAF